MREGEGRERDREWEKRGGRRDGERKEGLKGGWRREWGRERGKGWSSEGRSEWLSGRAATILENLLFSSSLLVRWQKRLLFLSFSPYSLISISYNTGVSLSVVLLAELAGIGLAGMLVMMIRRKMAAKPAGYTLLPHQSWTDLGLGSTTEICTDLISFSHTCRSTLGPIVAGNLGNFYPGDWRRFKAARGPGLGVGVSVIVRALSVTVLHDVVTPWR